MNLSEPIAEGRIAQIYPWDDGKILKLARDWVSADWLAYEYHIAKIVHATGLNVPEPFEQIEVEGRAGIVYARVEGKTMLSHIGRAPHKAIGFGRTLARLHREMHTKPGAPDLPNIKERLRGKIESVNGAPPEIRAQVLEKLNTLPEGDRLLHGDFHPDNVIFSPAGKGFDPVIIDWPDASRGHPLADVARTSVLIRAGGLPRQPILRVLVSLFRSTFYRAYLNTYFKHAPTSRTDLQAWLLPVTFGRLSEDIASERAWLIGEVCGMLGIPIPENILEN
ncbi:MAG: phosphotransferase [Anaerolineales bacterium]|nr:phosphotransferase [Anaerolineales bacterium]